MKPSIETYAELLKQGSIVAFPTETVYGLGASAWNPQAIVKVFEAKKRPADNPLIVHVSSVAMLSDFAEEVPFPARQLMQKFWPGPLTMIFRKKKKVLDLISAGLDTVAVRMPNHPVALRLIDLAGPLVGPSANTSGKPSPTHPDHILEDFGKSIPIIEGGRCEIGLESTVIDMTGVIPVILRPGYITPNMIKEQTGIDVITSDSMTGHESGLNPDSRHKPDSRDSPDSSHRPNSGHSPDPGNTHVPRHSTDSSQTQNPGSSPDRSTRTGNSDGSAAEHDPDTTSAGHEPDTSSAEQGSEISAEYGFTGTTPRSPGLKYSHYAPNAKVRWMEKDEVPARPGTLYLLHYNRPVPLESPARSVDFFGDYRRMARELYDWFRKADYEGYSCIAIEPFRDDNPDELFAALKNRIDKAIGG